MLVCITNRTYCLVLGVEFSALRFLWFYRTRGLSATATGNFFCQQKQTEIYKNLQKWNYFREAWTKLPLGDPSFINISTHF